MDGYQVNDVVLSEATQFLSRFEDNSIPLIIADPPYGIGYHSNHYKDKNPHAPIANDWNFQIGKFMELCKRKLMDGGALYLFSRYDVVPIWLPYMQGNQLQMKTKIVWVKNNWSAGDLEGCFGNQYEEILFIVKGRHKIRGRRWSNVWEFDRIPAKQLLHPAQKPEEMLRRIIESSSDIGDLVVDPFAGSGSTGVAAKTTNRKFMLCDIDPRMVNVCKVRLGLPAIDQDELSTNGEPVTDYAFEFPSLESWGIHPEEVAYLISELKENISLSNPQLSLLTA